MPSPTSRTCPTSLVASWPLKSSISFCRTEAISSALNFMETPLLDAVAQLRHPRGQRAIVNGVADPDHNSADQRRIDLGLEYGFEGERFGQALPQAVPRLVAERHGRFNLHPLFAAPRFLAQPSLPRNQRDQVEPIVTDEHPQKIRQKRTRLAGEDAIDEVNLFVAADDP